MTEKEADQIIDFLYGMFRPPDPQETRKAWRLQLAHLDPDLATQAAINGAQVWEFFPKWPVFYGEYRALRRNERRKEEVYSCATCKGDRFVLVATRPAAQTDWMQKRGFEPQSPGMEEYAPCPECNASADTSFYRHDNTEFRAPDPATVRRLMSS